MTQTPGFISTAQTEYFRRPKDERFPSLDAFVKFSEERKAACREVGYRLQDLRIVPTDSTVLIESRKAQAHLTPWAHGQICRTVGAPAGYIRTLPPVLQADALNHGIKTMPADTKAQLLIHRNGGLTARSITSQTYGRLWDADAYGPVRDTLGAHGWGMPPTWDGQPAGVYGGDRDSFIILTNGGSMVTDPSARGNVGGGNGAMYRGILLRNSEVGASAWLAQLIFYRAICGNHLLWGAVIAGEFRRRHVGSNVLRDVLRDLGRTARQWVSRPASADEAIIRHLIATEVGKTREACIAELVKMGATKADAGAAYDACERTENASPRSYWGLAQGLTRISQTSGYQDSRLELDRLAAQLQARGARQLQAA